MSLTQLPTSMYSFDSGPLAFRNRIINGNMQIDQRNAGASVTPTNNSYSADRWSHNVTAASKFTTQQVSGTPPTGFVNYLRVTSSSSYTVGTTDIFSIRQFIEGYNVADFGWGAAGAASVTLSFWVRSSLTGTFGGCVRNSAGDRSYMFSYAIAAANTWEQKSIVITGDTTGTWLKDSSIGLNVSFSIGTGSTYSGTAGSWTAGTYISVTGATSVVGTSGATFDITGVQLEKGTTATPFEFRPIGTELALCQRYYRQTATAASQYGEGSIYGYSQLAGVSVLASAPYPVTMRVAPTATVQGAWSYGNTNAPTSGILPNASGYAYFATALVAGSVSMNTLAAGYLTFNAEL